MQIEHLECFFFFSFQWSSLIAFTSNYEQTNKFHSNKILFKKYLIVHDYKNKFWNFFFQISK